MKILFVLLIVFTGLFAQENDPYKILDDVKNKFEEIEDYSADVNIKVDVSFLRVPTSKAKLYFRKPNDVKLKSSGFALLPKQGFDFTPTKLLDREFDAIYVQEVELNEIKYDQIKVLPKNDTTGVLLVNVLVDRKHSVIKSVESTTKNTGTAKIEFFYSDIDGYYMPDSTKISFNVKNVQLPSGMTGEFDQDDAKRSKNLRTKMKEPMEGTVVVEYSNYIINKGIPSEIFEEDEEK